MPLVKEISASQVAVQGLKAQRTRMNVIANNIANAMTTRMPDGGGAFRRQMAQFQANQLGPSFGSDKFGVSVSRVVADESPMRTVFDPGHPDANAEGYVEYPNIEVSVEMIDLLSAQRAYEANVAVIASARRMRQKALEIIQA